MFLRLSSYEINSNNFIVNNWTNKPLVNLTFVGVNDGCPSGYNPIKLGQTPMIKSGWDCTFPNQTVNKRGKEDFYGIFDVRQIDKNCTYISQNDPVDIYSWRGVKLCGKYLNYDYFTMKIANQTSMNNLTNTNITNISNTIDYSNVCPNNYKPCGIIDTYNNILCVLTNEQCPINNLQVFNNDASIYNNYNNLTQVKLDFPVSFEGNYTFNKSLIVSYSSNLINGSLSSNKIISEIKIVDGDVCANPMERSFSKSRSYKLFEDYEYYNTCNTVAGDLAFNINTNYKRIDSDYGKNVYRDYKLYSYNLLPLFPDFIYSDTPRFNLYSSSYIGLNTNTSICKVNKANFNIINQNNQSNITTLDHTYIAIITSTTIIIVVLFVSFPFTYISKSDKNEQETYTTCKCIMTILFSLSVLTLIIVCITFYALTTDKLTSWRLFNEMTASTGYPDQTSYLSISNVYNCTDKVTGNILVALAQLINNYYINFCIIFVITSLLGLFPLIIFAIYRFMQKINISEKYLIIDNMNLESQNIELSL